MIVFNDETLLVHNPKTAGTLLITYLLSTLPGPVHTAGVRQLGTYHPSLSMSMGYAAAVVGTMSFKRVISVIRNHSIEKYRCIFTIATYSPHRQR